MTKDVLWANLEVASLDAAIELEDRNQLMLGFTENLPEAIRAFDAGRPPAYTDEPRRDLFQIILAPNVRGHTCLARSAWRLRGVRRLDAMMGPVGWRRGAAARRSRYDVCSACVRRSAASSRAANFTARAGSCLTASGPSGAVQAANSSRMPSGSKK